MIEQLELSPSRIDRPMNQISNERWNASVAIGLARRKSLFCFPFLDRNWKERLVVRLATCAELLKERQCTMIIPSDNEEYLHNVVDEWIRLD